MQIERAQAVCKEYGYTLDYRGDNIFELRDTLGDFETEELYKGQIAEMTEEDFIEFYLS